MTPELDAFAAGLAIPVPLPAIEKELASLWRMAESEGGARASVTRACLWNLVVRTSDESGFQRAKELVDAISPKLPARVLVLKTDRGAATARPRAWIEANWHTVGGGGKQIGSEELTIEGCGDAVDDLAPVVRALLVPDVPTAALWYGPTPDAGSPLDLELLRAADRIIVGGESERDLRALGQLCGSDPRTRAQPMALAWLRLGAWRQLLASLFDPPVPPGELYTVDKVEITCPPGRAGAALLYVGWLASRLRWREGRRLEAGSYAFHRPRGGVAVQVELRRSAPDPIASVALRSKAGVSSVARHDATVILNTPTIAYRAPLVELTEPELWIAALSGIGRDPLFVEALARVATIAV